MFSASEEEIQFFPPASTSSNWICNTSNRRFCFLKVLSFDPTSVIDIIIVFLSNPYIVEI